MRMWDVAAWLCNQKRHGNTWNLEDAFYFRSFFIRPPMGVMAVPVGMRPMGQWGQRGQWGFLELVLELGLDFASRCWACFCSVHLQGLEIVCHCITQAIEKEAKLTIATFMFEVHSLKDPLWVSLFPSQTVDWSVGWLACAGWSLGEGERDVQKPSWHWWAHNLWFILAVCWLLVLLNLFDRACWTRPFLSACKEAGV